MKVPALNGRQAVAALQLTVAAAVAALPLSVPGYSATAQSTAQADRSAEAGDNLLFIGRGGIAAPDGHEEARHWSTYTINLVDGSPAYGWLSTEAQTLPHTLNFELAATATLRAVALDNRLAGEVREDGGLSQSGEGAPVRRFALLGSTVGPDGPFEVLVEGEAGADGRTVVPFPSSRVARWLRLRIDSNWAGAGTTRLSELEVLGELSGMPAATEGDASGVYSHEYGPILIRQQGNEIRGCYNDGLGALRGAVFGRVMRLGWFSQQEGSIGAATLVAANQRLHGFWYRPDDRMGSPWNAVWTGPLPAKVPVACRAALGF